MRKGGREGRRRKGGRAGRRRTGGASQRAQHAAQPSREPLSQPARIPCAPQRVIRPFPPPKRAQARPRPVTPSLPSSEARPRPQNPPTSPPRAPHLRVRDGEADGCVEGAARRRLGQPRLAVGAARAAADALVPHALGVGRRVVCGRICPVEHDRDPRRPRRARMDEELRIALPRDVAARPARRRPLPLAARLDRAQRRDGREHDGWAVRVDDDFKRALLACRPQRRPRRTHEGEAARAQDGGWVSARAPCATRAIGSAGAWLALAVLAVLAAAALCSPLRVVGAHPAERSWARGHTARRVRGAARPPRRACCTTLRARGRTRSSRPPERQREARRGEARYGSARGEADQTKPRQGQSKGRQTEGSARRGRAQGAASRHPLRPSPTEHSHEPRRHAPSRARARPRAPPRRRSRPSRRARAAGSGRGRASGRGRSRGRPLWPRPPVRRRASPAASGRARVTWWGVTSRVIAERGGGACQTRTRARPRLADSCSRPRVVQQR